MKIPEPKDRRMNENEKWEPYRGYYYTELDEGGISVRRGEIYDMLDNEPLRVRGYYNDENDYETHIDVELEHLLKGCVIGGLDMFGEEHRASKEKVIQLINKIYSENNWNDIYRYEALNNDIWE